MDNALHIKKPLPVGSVGIGSSVGWWGVWTLIVTEGSLFGYLLLSYFYYYFQTPGYWPPEGRPELLMPGINTAILLSSSLFVHVGERLVHRRSKRWSTFSMLIGILLGIAFVAIQIGEWKKKSYSFDSNLYGSLYFTITGFHMAHVVVGIVVLSLLMLWTSLGYFSGRRHTAMTIGGLYWHFVDAVWLVIFTSLYLLPYLVEK